MKRLLPIILGVGLLLNITNANSQGSTFNFTTTGFTAEMDSALEYTGQIWGAYLNSNVPIKVNVYYATLGVGTTLGITVPNGERDFTNAPLDSVWYPTCLANSLADVELNPGEADMDVFINNTVNWYWGIDAAPSPGKYDFVTVMLHEIGHGLGFLSLAKMEDTLGSFGHIVAADLAPLVTSFPFPDLQGKYSVFSSFMENGSGQQLDDTLIFPNQSTTLASEFTSNDLYFNGPNSFIVNSNNTVRLYAPVTYAPGSSMEHINEGSFPAPNSLMTPFVTTNEINHIPGPLTIAILEDIGWNVNHDVGLEDDVEIGLQAYPNPATNWLNIRPSVDISNADISIFDLSGRKVYSRTLDLIASDYSQINIEELSSGLYTLRVNDSCIKIIKQ